jgi:hypothetical protein
MRKKSLVFVLILSVLVFGINCFVDRSSIVEADIVKADVSKLQGNLHNWIFEHNTEGVYIGRIPKTNKREEYYVYLNYKKSMGFSVSSNGKTGLVIDWEVGQKADSGAKLFEISTKNKRPDYITFGGKKMDVMSIPIIKE